MEKRGEKFVVTKKTFTLTFELLISELKDTPAYRRLVGKKKCTFLFSNCFLARAARINLVFISSDHSMKIKERKASCYEEKIFEFERRELSCFLFFILYEDSVKTERKKPGYLR